MAKKKILDTTNATIGTTTYIQEPVSAPEQTHKQVLEALHAEMVRYGIHSIGQLEVLISKQ